jgi:solute:Na+ symporter, SSS family
MFMPEFSLHRIDLIIILSYILFSIAIGLYLSRKHDSAEDYFLAGRSMIWPFIGVSLFASNISSTTLIGLSGDAYATGIAVYNYEWVAAVILVFYCIFILPTVLRSRLYTMPEFLERRYSKGARQYFSLLTIFLNIIIDTAGSLYAGGLFLKLVFPELPMAYSIAIIAVIAGIYTVAGGLAAVIYTDALQTLFLLAGSITLSVFALERAGGWSQVTSAIPAEKLSLIMPWDDTGVPWPGLVTGVLLLSFYFWCTNQFMVQRVLSARNIHHGRWGALLAGLMKLPVLFIMVLPGSFAILLYPDLDKPDMVFPTLVFDLLPVGLIGLVTGGFIAALMSQIDSTLNSASTLVTMDFVQPRWPKLSQHQLMRVGQIVTFIFMVLSVLWAPQIEHFGSLFKYLQKVLSYTVPPVLALFIFGFFSRHANETGARAALILGTLLGVALFVLIEVLGVFHLHFLYVAPLLFIFSSLVISIVSRGGPAPAPEIVNAYVWKPADYRAETEALAATPLWANYRVLSLGLLLLTAIVVGTFW